MLVQLEVLSAFVAVLALERHMLESAGRLTRWQPAAAKHPGATQAAGQDLQTPPNNIH